MIEPGKPYIGIIMEGVDLEKANKYAVYIRSLSTPGVMNLFYVTNELMGNNFSRWIDPKKHASQMDSRKSAGAYFPLTQGMVVEVIFRSGNVTDGYVYKIINKQGYLPIPQKLKEKFYLLCKTPQNSYVYVDENRQITHLMNSKGETNVYLDPNKIILHAGKLLNGGADGITPDSIIEVTKTGIKLKFKDNYIKIDEAGITFNVGKKAKSHLKITENGITCAAEKDVIIKSDTNLNLIGQKAKLTGTTHIDIHSTQTKVSGAQLMAITGNTVSVDSMLETYIKGGHIGIDSLSKLKLSSLVIDIESLTSLYISSLTHTNSSQLLTNIATTISNSASVIANDGSVMSNMGVGSSVGTSMQATSVATSVGTEAAAAALTTGLMIDEPISACCCGVMNSTLTGCANAAGGLLQDKIIVPPISTGVSGAVKFLHQFENAANKNVTSPLPTPITI